MRGYALMRARRIRRLGAMPVLCEAAVDSAVFIGVYGMPPALGFTGGFILSALSPTVLVTGAAMSCGLSRYLAAALLWHAAGMRVTGASVGPGDTAVMPDRAASTGRGWMCGLCARA